MRPILKKHTAAFMKQFHETVKTILNFSLWPTLPRVFALNPASAFTSARLCQMKQSKLKLMTEKSAVN